MLKFIEKPFGNLKEIKPIDLSNTISYLNQAINFEMKLQGPDLGLNYQSFTEKWLRIESTIITWIDDEFNPRSITNLREVVKKLEINKDFITLLHFIRKIGLEITKTTINDQKIYKIMNTGINNPEQRIPFLIRIFSAFPDLSRNQEDVIIEFRKNEISN